MKVYKLVLGELETNCFIIATGAHNAIAVDPADNAAVIIKMLGGNSLTLKKILLTHGHFDHIGAVSELAENTGAEVYIHESDFELLSDARKNGSFILGRDITPASTGINITTTTDGDVISLDDVSLKVMHTPGHTNGSAVYIDDEHKFMYAGDTVFKGSIGRNDLYGGDPAAQRISLVKIKSLDINYNILCGHGEDTTLEEEKHTNPYLGRV